MKLIATQISRIHPPTIAIPTGVGDMGSKTASAKRESKPSNQDSARIVADGPTSAAHDWLLNNSIEIGFLEILLRNGSIPICSVQDGHKHLPVLSMMT